LHVAVAIVAFRNADDVVACLNALNESEHRDFEVVVCENGGQLAFDELRARMPAVLAEGQKVRGILAAGNVGYAGGVNVCMAATPDADAWWVLNPDTAPTASALRVMVGRLQRGDCDAVGGVICSRGGAIQSLGGLWRPQFARAVSLGHGRPVAEVGQLSSAVERQQNYLNGASMLISRNFLQKAGPMREDYFLYCEEVEWCLRARASGLRLAFEPSAVIPHEQGTTTGNPREIHGQGKLPVYLNERNRLLLTRDLFPDLYHRAVIMALILIFLRFARRGAWRQLGYALTGWLAGLRGERGRPVWA